MLLVFEQLGNCSHPYPCGCLCVDVHHFGWERWQSVGDQFPLPLERQLHSRRLLVPCAWLQPSRLNDAEHKRPWHCTSGGQEFLFSQLWGFYFHACVTVNYCQKKKRKKKKKAACLFVQETELVSPKFISLSLLTQLLCIKQGMVQSC